MSDKTVTIVESSEDSAENAQRLPDTEGSTVPESGAQSGEPLPCGSGETDNTRKRKASDETETEPETDTEAKRQRNESSEGNSEYETDTESEFLDNLLKPYIDPECDEDTRRILTLDFTSLHNLLVYSGAIILIIRRLIAMRANNEYLLLIKSCIKKELINVLVHIIQVILKVRRDEDEDEDDDEYEDTFRSQFNEAWNILIRETTFVLPRFHHYHESLLTSFKDLLLSRSIVEVTSHLNCAQCGIIRPGFEYDNQTIHNDVILMMTWFIQYVHFTNSRSRVVEKVKKQLSKRH